MCNLCVKKQQSKVKYEAVRVCGCGRCAKGKKCKCGKCEKPCCPPKVEHCYVPNNYCLPEPCPPKPVCCPPKPEPCCPPKTSCGCSIPTPAPIEPMRAYGSASELAGPVGLDYLELDAVPLIGPTGYFIPVGPTGSAPLVITRSAFYGYLGVTGDFLYGGQLPLNVGSSSLLNVTNPDGGLRVGPGGDINLQYDVTIPDVNAPINYEIIGATGTTGSFGGNLRTASILVAVSGSAAPRVISESARLVVLDRTFTSGVLTGPTASTLNALIPGLDHVSGTVLQKFDTGTRFYLVLLSAIGIQDSTNLRVVDVDTGLTFDELPPNDASASLTAILQKQFFC